MSSQIAVSPLPLYQTRARPVSWPIALTNPDGTPVDLTGASASAYLRWSDRAQSLAHTPLDATGLFVVSADAVATADLPVGGAIRMTLTIQDAQGGFLDLVWPVIGEDL